MRIGILESGLMGGRLKPERLVTCERSLGDVSGTLERMTRFGAVGFEVIMRFA